MIMLLSNERIRPCLARILGSSFARVTTILPSSCETTMSGIVNCLSVPLGPVTVISCGSTVIVTPFGMVIGSFPIRLITVILLLVHFTDKLATNALRFGFGAGHQPLGSRYDDDTATILDGRDFLGVDIITAAWLTETVDLGNASVFHRTIQDDGKGLGGAFTADADVIDKVVGLQHLGDCCLYIGMRQIYLMLAYGDSIAHTGQHVGDRIGRSCVVHMYYQLAFVTPGISPLAACSRKLRRERPNTRM